MLAIAADSARRYFEWRVGAFVPSWAGRYLSRICDGNDFTPYPLRSFGESP